MKRSLLYCFIALVCLPLAACFADVRVEDDLDFQLFAYDLHTPYVVGADVGLHVSRRDDASVTGWTVDAGDSAIFEVVPGTLQNDGDDIWVDGLAVAPGETKLLIYDESGHLETSRAIRVEMPDRIDLVPAGLIKVRGDGAEAVASDEPIRVLEGGQATFEVQYYKGAERLFGNNALTVTVDDALLEAETDQTYLFENREWLRLTPDATGIHEISLSVGGSLIATYDVEVVTADVIEGVEIEAEPAGKAEKDDLLYLLAHAYDDQSRDIWGVDFDWAVDDLAEPGDGDLYYYYYDPDADHVVSAARNGYSDEMTVFMSDGGVSSSNSIGCNAAGSATGLVAFLLPLLWLGWRRRSRR